MAAFRASFRPSSISWSLVLNQIASHVLYVLTLLPLTLAAFAFVLQWRGSGVNDPSAATERLQFPGTAVPHSSLSDSLDLLAPLHTSYLRDLKFNLDPETKISIASSTSAGLPQILPWILYHKVIGVSNFFLFTEGKAASHNVTRVLQSIPGVKVVCRTKQLEEQQAKSRIWNEAWLAGFMYKPCNYELFVKQCLNMEMAVAMARDAGMEWIFHLDTDELIHPAGTSEYSVKQLLDEVPENVDIAVFPNYEGCVERDDVKDPFSEVSMFKKNYDHLSKVLYYIYYKQVARNNPSYYLTYGNGKSAARVQDHLRPHGAHRWENYMKAPNELKLQTAAILHYTYNRFSDLTSRRDRCNCKPTEEGVKKCFMLSFDRNAYIIASTATQQEMHRWYREHVVWTNKTQNIKLLQVGLLTRIHAPMVILQGLRESGVFSSVIESSLHTNVTVGGFFSSLESNTSSREVTSTAFPSRQLDETRESEATARKVLEAAGEGIDKAAMPPLPPPVPSDRDRDMAMLQLKMAF